MIAQEFNQANTLTTESPSMPFEGGPNDPNRHMLYNNFNPNEQFDHNFLNPDSENHFQMPSNNLDMKIDEAFVPKEQIEVFEINLKTIEKYGEKRVQ